MERKGKVVDQNEMTGNKNRAAIIKLKVAIFPGIHRVYTTYMSTFSLR